MSKEKKTINEQISKLESQVLQLKSKNKALKRKLFRFENDRMSNKDVKDAISIRNKKIRDLRKNIELRQQHMEVMRDAGIRNNYKVELELSIMEVMLWNNYDYQWMISLKDKAPDPYWDTKPDHEKKYKVDSPMERAINELKDQGLFHDRTKFQGVTLDDYRKKREEAERKNRDSEISEE